MLEEIHEEEGEYGCVVPRAATRSFVSSILREQGWKMRASGEILVRPQGFWYILSMSARVSTLNGEGDARRKISRRTAVGVDQETPVTRVVTDDNLWC